MKDTRKIYHLRDMDEPRVMDSDVGYIKTVLSEKEFEKVIAIYKKKYPEDYCFDGDFIKWMNKTYDPKAEIIEVVDVHF